MILGQGKNLVTRHLNKDGLWLMIRFQYWFVNPYKHAILSRMKATGKLGLAFSLCIV